MRIIIESTSKTVTLNGVPARIWEGHTASGIPVHCYLTRIAVAVDFPGDLSQFEAELVEHRAPRNPDIEAIPHRLVL